MSPSHIVHQIHAAAEKRYDTELISGLVINFNCWDYFVLMTPPTLNSQQGCRFILYCIALSTLSEQGKIKSIRFSLINIWCAHMLTSHMLTMHMEQTGSDSSLCFSDFIDLSNLTRLHFHFNILISSLSWLLLLRAKTCLKLFVQDWCWKRRVILTKQNHSYIIICWFFSD